MVAFTPKSKATTRRPLVAPVPAPGWTLGSVAVTPDTRSIPSVPAAAAAAARSSASGAVPNAQGTAPASRTCRVSRRVSTPVRAGTPCRRRKGSRASVERQLDGSPARSQTTIPRQRGTAASSSRAFVP